MSLPVSDSVGCSPNFNVSRRVRHRNSGFCCDKRTKKTPIFESCLLILRSRNNCLSVIPGESWESLGVINNCAESRGEIVRFYRAFPANFGLQAVCDLWAIGGKTANIPKNYTGRGYHKRFSEQADAENPDALLLETTKQDLADILRLYKRDIKAAEDEAKRVADLKAAKKVVSGKKGKKGGKK